MQQYRYRALDRNGDEVLGSIEAESLHDASEKLRAAEIVVTAIEDTSGERRYEPEGAHPGPSPRDVQVGIGDTSGGWVFVLTGGLFAGIALLFIVIGLGLTVGGTDEGLYFVFFPLIHLAIGLLLLRYVFSRRKRRQSLYRDGEVAMATVDGVGFNRSVRVNGRNPREMTWSFALDDQRFHDKRSSFDDRLATFAPGDRLWVLYDPDDPEESVEWPPFKG